MRRDSAYVNSCWPTLVGMRRSSAETKAVILARADSGFAESGFERATIRAIAADANIDPSMVMRYFGSKDQLFAAAADFDLQIPDLSDVERDQLGERDGHPLLESMGRRRGSDCAAEVKHHESRSSATDAEIFAGQLLPADREDQSRRARPPCRPGRDAGAGYGAVPLRPAGAAGGRHVTRRTRRLARADSQRYLVGPSNFSK